MSTPRLSRPLPGDLAGLQGQNFNKNVERYIARLEQRLAALESRISANAARLAAEPAIIAYGVVTTDGAGNATLVRGAGCTASINANDIRITFTAPRASADYLVVVSDYDFNPSHQFSVADNTLTSTHFDIEARNSAGTLVGLDSRGAGLMFICREAS